MIDVDYNEYKDTLAENMKLIVENNRLKEVEKEHKKLNGELREEIERLNNIINEFEKWLESESNFWKKQQEKAIEKGWLEFGGKYNTTIIYENAINKLQELKGSVSNE